MSPFLILGIFLAYTVLIFVVTYLTSRQADNQTFFIGNKVSPWYVVAYGMIGASLSGVTFMSVPGAVRDTQFTYMVMVFGFLAGYFVIATILLPLYYRLNLTSIYTYLEQRFGFWTYKTGASFFMISRILGASFRMFLVVNVLQVFVFDAWGIPFFANVLLFITLIILYTLRGGIKTIVWTDTLQTTFMLLAVAMSIYFISKEMHTTVTGLASQVWHSSTSRMMIWDWHNSRFFLKQFLSGMFIAIVMTGLDQEMMQKNLSCKNLREAQINMFTFSGTLVFVNLMFLFLGAVLMLYMSSHSITLTMSDNIFPTIALQYLGPVAGVVFMIGLISAAYPSADGALTSLTTSFCIDFLGFNRLAISDKQKRRIRYRVHLSVAAIFLVVIVIFRAINDKAVIEKLYTIAGYTYGPLLGFFSFGLFTKWQVRDKWVPLVAVISPVISYVLSVYSVQWFNGYKMGFELLIINGLITFLGLFLLRKEN
ncbi:MAG: sodium:solute symporter [Bacteroidota bacterium]|nr:sodium:solute symporter [Bacteroidota bacterium]